MTWYCSVKMKAIDAVEVAIWVAAYIRRCNLEGAFVALRRRGAEEAGAIFVKINRLDGTAELLVRRRRVAL